MIKISSVSFSRQAIHQQLQEALEEQEGLKIQTAEYARQVARVEELLAQKVRLRPQYMTYQNADIFFRGPGLAYYFPAQ